MRRLVINEEQQKAVEQMRDRGKTSQARERDGGLVQPSRAREQSPFFHLDRVGSASAGQ